MAEITEDCERTDTDANFDQERDKVALFDQERVEEEKMALQDDDGTAEEREQNKDDSGTFVSGPKAEPELDGEALIQFSETCPLVEDASLQVLTQHVDNISSEERLLPVELIDSITMTKSSVLSKIGEEDKRDVGNDQVETNDRAPEENLVSASIMENADVVEMCSSVPTTEEPEGNCSSVHQQCAVSQEIPTPASLQVNVDAEVEASVAVEDIAGPQRKLFILSNLE